VFLSIKPQHVSVFFHDYLQGSSAVLCAVTIPPADLRTHISGRNSNGTKHSGELHEDGREKRSKNVGVLYLKTRF
jgi:hypothetical protein